MAVNRHITSSAYQGGNFTVGRLPTITQEFFLARFEFDRVLSVRIFNVDSSINVA